MTAAVGEAELMKSSVDFQSRQYMNMLRKGTKINLGQNADEIQSMSKTLRQKLSTMLSEQTDKQTLEKLGLPVVPKLYQEPLINNHLKGKN